MPNRPRASACRQGAAALTMALLLSTAVNAAPPIRTGPDNKVPACVSPDRLMAFLRERNGDLDPRYADIARHYKYFGEAWRVRWDYAFYQMVLETNYLKYRRGDGRRGDVHEKQNNFAGIGATGGGVAGERFNDVKTGVHAQIQHLVAYSGEVVQEPVAKRTRENQDDIIAKSKRLGRKVTFGDLARRWAADRQYAKNIDFVAGQFNDGYCDGPALAEDTSPPKPQPARRFARPSGLGGPKPEPQMLAGPETLPWQGEDQAVTQAQAVQDAAPSESPPPQRAPEPAKKAGPPVRTLWSRDKGHLPAPVANPAASPAKPPEQPAQQSADANAHAARPVQGANEQARPAGSMAPEASAAPRAEDAAPPELPTFRIAPEKSEPSRLGGPVPAKVPAGAKQANAMPAGTFVEMDPPPLPAAPEVRQVNFAAPKPAATAVSKTAPSDGPQTRGLAGSTGEACRILTASYGGKKTLLVQSEKNGTLQLTALTVLEGFENSMVASYAKAEAPGAKVIAAFPTKDAALSEAKTICPGG